MVRDQAGAGGDVTTALSPARGSSVAGIDPAAGKHRHPPCERHGAVARHHQDFRSATVRRAAKDHDGRGGDRGGLLSGVHHAILAGDRLLGEIFGSYYAAGGPTLKVLAIGNLLFTWGGCPGLVLSMGGRQRVNMVINLLTLFVIVAVGAALSRLQGPIGMAYAMGAAGIINKGLSLWLVRKDFGIAAEARLLPSRRIAAVRS